MAEVVFSPEEIAEFPQGPPGAPGAAGPAGVEQGSVFCHQANDPGNARNSVSDVNVADLAWGAAGSLIRNDRPSNPVGYRDTTAWTTV
jgi:hypothetical protein